MRSRVYISFLWCLLLGGCSKSVPEFRHEQGVVVVNPGTDFKILFNENHAKGQTWSLVYEFDFSRLEYVKSNYHGPKEGLTDFIFHAKNSGETELKFNLVEYSEVIRQAKVKVKIK